MASTPKAKRVPTWSEVAIHHGGYRDAMRALEFAMDWGMACVVLEREPESVEEYAEVAEVSRATAFRNQQAFRRAFPMLEGPSDLNRRAGMSAAYEEVKTLALDPVNLRPFQLAKIFTLGAKKANLPKTSE